MKTAWQHSLNESVNAAQRFWLTRTDSITRALEEKIKQKISIKLLYNDWGLGSAEECQQLSQECEQLFFIREIELFVHNDLFLLGRSVIPTATLRKNHPELEQLGTSSLGHFLFNYPKIQREQLEFTSQRKILAEYKCLDAYQDCLADVIARRSVFKLQNHPLLLTEFFMPSFKEIVDVT